MYRNSWLFSPVVWDVLSDKLLEPDEYGFKPSIISLHGNEVWLQINDIMNQSDSAYNRICWELSNQQIFFTKDKEMVAENIRRFTKENRSYCMGKDDGIGIFEKEHIIERWEQIASDIESLDEDKYPYFVFKNTSVDDSVRRWFYSYNEDSDEYTDKSLKEWDELVTEFVVIADGNIVKFIDNLDYEYPEM